MIKYQDEVFSTHGDVIPYAVVTVYLAGTSTLATLYANSAGSASLVNPVAANYTGYFYFYAASGTYDLVITGTGITQIIYTDVTLGGGGIAGQFVVDGIAYTTIQAAITAAGTTGSVTIPSSYAGTDTYTNPNGIQIIDLRRLNSSPNRQRGYINMLVDCGLKGDGVTDDAIAANACFAAYPGREFRFPKTQTNGTCNYLFGATLTPSGAGTVIRGEGGGSYGLTFGNHFGGTELCFTPGITGLWLDNVAHSMIVENLSFNGQAGSASQGNPALLNLTAGANLPHYTRNISAIQRATNVLTVTVSGVNAEGLTIAVGSTVKISGVVGDATMNGLCIVATMSNTATNPLTFTCTQNGADAGAFGAVGTISLPTTGSNAADGIRVCGNFHTLRHVAIGNFGRHGISAQSDDPVCVSSFADDLVVRDSMIYGNQAHGIFLKGADSNAGTFNGNALYYNGIWGANDQSFLGNTWFGNQASYNGLAGAAGTTPATKNISTISRTLTGGSSQVSVVLSQADTSVKLGSCVVIAGVTDSSFNSTVGQCFFVNSFTNSTHYGYEQPGAPVDASSSGGTSRMAKFTEAFLSAGLDNGSYKIGTQSATQGNMAFAGNYTEGGQNCKFGTSGQPRIGGAIDPSCVPNSGLDWTGNFIGQVAGLNGVGATNIAAFANNKDTNQNLYFRAGVSGGVTTRSTFMRWYNNNTNLDGYALSVDPSGTDGSTGSWILTTGLSTLRRIAFFGKNNSNGVTRINSESIGAIGLNIEPNTGTGGVIFGSGSASPSTVATVDSTGKGTFNGGIVAGASGSTISDSRELIQNAHSCGTTTTCANTANGSNRIIFGSVALSSGTPSTATVASITPFTSSSSYFCVVTNTTSQANPLKVANVSSSSFTITGPNTVTDTVNYQCIGN